MSMNATETLSAAPTTAELDEYYDDLIYEEETGRNYASDLAEHESEMYAENAWLRHAESRGLDHKQELEEEGLL